MEEQNKNINEEVEMEEELIVLIDEDDKEHTFELIETFTVDGENYAALVPWDEEEDDSAIVLKIKVENDEEMLYDIEDDAEWQKVVDYWNAYVDSEEE